MMHGSGIKVYADGNKYEGLFKLGKRSGYGSYYFSDDQIYKS